LPRRGGRAGAILRESLTHQLIRRAGDIRSIHRRAARCREDEQTIGAALETAPSPGEAIELKAFGHAADVAAAWRRPPPAAIPRRLQHRARLPDIGADQRHRLRAGAALSASRQRARVQFFFLPPLYTFTIADPENVVALFFFALWR